MYIYSGFWNISVPHVTIKYQLTFLRCNLHSERVNKGGRGLFAHVHVGMAYKRNRDTKCNFCSRKYSTYSRKYWWGIIFGGLAVLLSHRQYCANARRCGNCTITAKFISANCNFLPFSSNPPNITPANISGYTVYISLGSESIVLVY